MERLSLHAEVANLAGIPYSKLMGRERRETIVGLTSQHLRLTLPPLVSLRCLKTRKTLFLTVSEHSRNLKLICKHCDLVFIV